MTQRLRLQTDVINCLKVVVIIVVTWCFNAQYCLKVLVPTFGFLS